MLFFLWSKIRPISFGKIGYKIIFQIIFLILFFPYFEVDFYADKSKIQVSFDFELVSRFLRFCFVNSEHLNEVSIIFILLHKMATSLIIGDKIPTWKLDSSS